MKKVRLRSTKELVLGLGVVNSRAGAQISFSKAHALNHLAGYWDFPFRK